MLLKFILDANEPLKRLSDKRCASYKKMREIVRLRKLVEQEVETYTAEEKKAVGVYAEVDKNGNPMFLEDGRLCLKDMDAKVAFEKEISALRETDIEDIQPVTLSETDFLSSDDYPTPSDVLALEGIVNFED